MLTYLPTYDECLSICERSAGLFYESKFFIDGYMISIFNYRLSTYNDFVDYKAFELRGLTFVFNLDGSVYKRFLLMEKFFNLNENDSVLFENLKNKKISSVYLKEDGSIINFIQLPNGKVVAKSKASLESDQARSAQEIYNTNENVKNYVDTCLFSDLNPIFELVGPKNQVVVKYENTKLILLRLRNNLCGKYLPLKDEEFEKPIDFKFTLSDLLNLKDNLEGIEGWVVEFEDSQKIKIKTSWYLSLHKILTDYTNREDYLIDLILDEKIDDILSVLDYGSESRIFVEKVINRTLQNLKDISLNVDKLVNDYNGDRKDFSIRYKSEQYFPIAIQVITGRDKDVLIKDFIKKKTYRLSGAREWLDF